MGASRFILVLALSCMGMALMLTACNDRNNVSGPRQVDFESAQFAIIDYGDVENGVEDATLETEMTFNATLLDYAVIGGDRPFGPGQNGLRGMRWYDRFDFGKHLGMIFRRLNLTDDQKSAVRDLVKTFHASMKPLVRQFNEAVKPIMQDANAKRRQINAELKAGTLTKEEAAARIKELNESTRNLMESNATIQGIKTAMCDERDKLFEAVSGILDEAQNIKWDNWIKRLKDPCNP